MFQKCGRTGLPRRGKNPSCRSFSAVSRTLFLLLALCVIPFSVLTSCARTEQETNSQPQSHAATDPNSNSSASSGSDTESQQSGPSSSDSNTEPASAVTSEPEPPTDDSWKLILVNAEHPLPEDFTVVLKELRNGHHVDERMYPELQQMFDDARSVGIYPFINESFRTAERQQQIMDKYIANYEAMGMKHEEAVKKAREIVALPGTSEHQLGLALDIIAEYDADSTATWKWLKKNCWKYGFILRYPADKVEITGISYEPWHFRYVGVEAAREIMERGICLEEYLGQ